MRGFMKPIAVIPLAMMALSGAGGIARGATIRRLDHQLAETNRQSRHRVHQRDQTRRQPAARRAIGFVDHSPGAASASNPRGSRRHTPAAGPSVNVTVNFPERIR